MMLSLPCILFSRGEIEVFNLLDAYVDIATSLIQRSMPQVNLLSFIEFGSSVWPMV